MGRTAELESFDAALAADEPPFSVLHVHGPGGIGKTTLTRVFEKRARELGRPTVRVDAHDTRPTVHELLQAIRDQLDVPPHADLYPALPGGIVVFLDTYERFAPVDDWVREQLVPALPGDALMVLSGRAEPLPGWWSDPAWGELLHTVALRNLPPDESTAYLRASGVPDDAHHRILDLTHGHPLALALVADTLDQGGTIEADCLSLDVVDALVRRFVGLVPSASHRRALETLTIARVVTEPTLRAMPDVEDPHAALEWLRGLSFVENTADGIMPHALAREALDAELKWRDPDTYRTVIKAVLKDIIARYTAPTGREQQRAAFDNLMLFRHVPAAGKVFDWRAASHSRAAPLRPDQLATALDIIETWHGQRERSIAEHWWRRQPDGFVAVLDDTDNLGGITVMLELSRAEAADLAVDPIAQAVAQGCARQHPSRPDKTFLLVRHMVDRDQGSEPSATSNLAFTIGTQWIFNTPNLGQLAIALRTSRTWDAYFKFVHFYPVPVELRINDHPASLWLHDFEDEPMDQWLNTVAEEIVQHGLRGHQVIIRDTITLSKNDFKAAVRRALRDLQRRDLLEQNPLRHSRLVGADGDSGTLAGILAQTVERLRDHPRDEKLFQVLNRTFLRPAPTQEKAAEELSLPFSTYRRHLTTGVDRVAESLWHRETRGAG